MIRNMGITDRIVRVIIGVVALASSLVFCFNSIATTILGFVLLAVAGLMFVTAAIGYCPTYQLFNISTEPTFHRVSDSKTKVAVHH